MKKNQRTKVLAGILAVLTVVAVVIIINYMHPSRPAPNYKGYYTGPMINKARTLIVDDNGKVYGPAPAEMNAPPSGTGAPSPASKSDGKTAGVAAGANKQ